jgi:hypothetical protein
MAKALFCADVPAYSGPLPEVNVRPIRISLLVLVVAASAACGSTSNSAGSTSTTSTSSLPAVSTTGVPPISLPATTVTTPASDAASTAVAQTDAGSTTGSTAPPTTGDASTLDFRANAPFQLSGATSGGNVTGTKCGGIAGTWNLSAGGAPISFTLDASGRGNWEGASVTLIPVADDQWNLQFTVPGAIQILPITSGKFC